MNQPLTAAVRFLSGEREPVRAATTGNLSSMQGLLVIDDVELDVGDRVLVKDQTDAVKNGIWLASEGIWFRAPDASYSRAINEGVTVGVQEGTVNNGRTYRFASSNPVVGVDPISIIYLYSDGAGFASAAQGALADSAVQPGDLGDSAGLDIGTTAGTVAAGDDSRILDALSVQDVASLTTVVSTVNLVRTSTHNLTSKLGRALYKKVEAEPAHALKEPALGGGWWEISEPQIDLTMVGAIGNATSGSSGYDNGTVLEDAFGYASLFGGSIKVPRGIYRTTQGVTVTMPDVKKVPGIIGEGKGASCFMMGTGDFTILEFESCARAVIEKIGFYKSAATDGGIGLKLSRIPWSRVLDVGVEGEYGAGGFERGVYLQNCLSSKIDLTARDNVYGLYADYLVDGAMFVSRPNHLEIRGEYGRNKRWGIRIDEPSQLDLMAVIEGNGWGVADTFRGGLYMPNAGTEGGSINIHNCYFELNAGTADIWAPQVINPGTTFNIFGNYFANLEEERSVTNHINIENGVAIEVNYNIWGNKFDSQGSYTPSALKKAITATTPALVNINLSGDKKQFTNLVEWPSAFGAMGLLWGGKVNADGTANAMPSGWTCSKSATGTYSITPPSHISISDYAFSAVTVTGDLVSVRRFFQSGSNMLVLTKNEADADADGAFHWTATGIR